MKQGILTKRKEGLSKSDMGRRKDSMKDSRGGEA